MAETREGRRLSNHLTQESDEVRLPRLLRLGSERRGEEAASQRGNEGTPILASLRQTTAFNQFNTSRVTSSRFVSFSTSWRAPS
jgi:hypothetical protein